MQSTTRRFVVAGTVAAAVVAMIVVLRVPEPQSTLSAVGDSGPATAGPHVRPDPASIDVNDAGAVLVLDTGERIELDFRDSGPGSTGVWSATFGNPSFDRLSFSIANVAPLEQTPTPTSDDLRLILRLGDDTWTSQEGECVVEVADVVGADGYGLRFTCDEPIGPGFAGVAVPFGTR